RSVWYGLTGRGAAPVNASVEQRISETVAARPELGIRLYRTPGGYRAIVTSHTIPPKSDESRQLLTALGSDPLYVRLCEQQECYRARLTPKPWRIGLQVPDIQSFPRIDEQAEREMEAWIKRYEHASRTWAACEFIADFGVKTVHPDVAPVLAWHDESEIGRAHV